MSWKDRADRLNRAIRDWFGEAILYRPASGGEFPIVATFDRAAAVVEIQAGVPVQSTRPAIVVRLADLATAPAQGDTCSRENGETFEVANVEAEGHGTVKLYLLELEAAP